MITRILLALAVLVSALGAEAALAAPPPVGLPEQTGELLAGAPHEQELLEAAAALAAELSAETAGTSEPASAPASPEPEPAPSAGEHTTTTAAAAAPPAASEEAPAAATSDSPPPPMPEPAASSEVEPANEPAPAASEQPEQAGGTGAAGEPVASPAPAGEEQAEQAGSTPVGSEPTATPAPAAPEQAVAAADPLAAAATTTTTSAGSEASAPGPELSQSSAGEQATSAEPREAQAAASGETGEPAPTSTSPPARGERIPPAQPLPGCGPEVQGESLAARARPKERSAVLAAQVTHSRPQAAPVTKVGGTGAEQKLAIGAEVTSEAAGARRQPRGNKAGQQQRPRSLTKPTQLHPAPAPARPTRTPVREAGRLDLSAARGERSAAPQAASAPGWLVAFATVSVALGLAALLVLAWVLVALLARRLAAAGPVRIRAQQPEATPDRRGGIRYRE